MKNKELYIREDIEQGSLSKAREIVKSFLEKKVDINTISECTGLTVEEINKL